VAYRPARRLRSREALGQLLAEDHDSGLSADVVAVGDVAVQGNPPDVDGTF
jgi:hypothetical protein